MANQTGNGRNEATSDEDRTSWRQDEGSMSMRDRDRDRDEERRYQDRYRDDERVMQRERERSASWDDRSSRGWDREDWRSGGWRSMDRGSQGQSGYGLGREGDRSYPSRYASHASSYDDRFGRGHEGGWGNEMGHGAQWERERQQGMYGQPGDWNQAGGSWSSGTHEQRYGYGQQGIYGGSYGQQGMRGGYAGTGYRPSYGRGPYNPSPQEPSYGSRQGYGGEQRYGYGPQRGEEHESIGQRIKGWFQGHRGKGPAGYIRSDERIRENVCEALSDDDRVDASNIEVTVKSGEVTLAGTVEDRLQKRLAEECIENISGVNDVQNLLRVAMPTTDVTRRGTTSPSTSTGTTTGSEPGQNGMEKRGRA
jgi:hypothetical protein